MNFNNNLKQKTLEILENEIWGEPEFDSHLVRTCHKLRKKQLKDFSIEDLRILIGQNIGLNFLIPLAIEELEKDILSEGNFYKGDLLHSIFNSEDEYWRKNKKKLEGYL